MDAIANSQFELTACELTLRDGTQVALGPELDRLNLHDAFANNETVRVCIAVPRFRPGMANTGSPADDSFYRYSEIHQEQPDENSGGNEQSIAYRKLNVRLCLDTDNLSGYEVLPIAQIRRASDRESTPHLDHDYCPPLLSVDCWPLLHRDLIRGIHDIVGRKIELVSQQVRNRGITLASGDPGDLERVFMLQVLNQADAALGCMAYAVGLHPLTLYVEMCRIVGQLSIFGRERRFQQLPRYDHDDLAGIFQQIRIRIDQLLGGVSEYEYEQRPFIGSDQGMAVTLEPKWFGDDWEWFVGVNSNYPNKRILQFLSPGRLDWKVGSSDEVELLFKHRAEGLRLNPVRQVPRALPPDDQWLFYEVNRSCQAWNRVAETQTLGMRFRKELILNLGELEGQQSLLVAAGQDSVEMKFALFAVPKSGGISRKQ